MAANEDVKNKENGNRQRVFITDVIIAVVAVMLGNLSNIYQILFYWTCHKRNTLYEIMIGWNVTFGKNTEGVYHPIVFDDKIK